MGAVVSTCMLDVDSQSSGSRGTLAPPEPRAGSWAAAIEAVLLLDASTGAPPPGAPPTPRAPLSSRPLSRGMPSTRKIVRL
jgi:hypothetical protein